MFRRDHPLFLPLVTFATLLSGFLITMGMFLGVRHLEHQKMRSDFHQSADIHLRTVVKGFEDMVHDLRTVTQLFIAVDKPTRDQFRVFVQPLLQRSPYIYALSYQRLLEPSERTAFEAQMRKRYPDFKIKELDWADASAIEKVEPITSKQLRIVDYIEPMQGNELAFGLDVSNSLALQGPTERARDTGLPSASNLFNVAQLRNNRLGFVIVMPVYRHGAVINTVEDRHREVVGYTSAVLRADQVVEKILENEGNQPLANLILHVYASATPDENALVYRSAIKPVKLVETSVFDHLPNRLFQDTPETISRTFDVAGKEWYVVAAIPVGRITKNHEGSLLVLLLGTILSLFGATYVYVTGRRSRQIQQLVGAQSQQVRIATELMKEDSVARKRAEQALQLRERAIESSAHAIIISSAAAPDYAIEYVNPAFERITGYTAEQVVGHNLEILQGADIEQIGKEEIYSAIREKRTGNAIFRSYRKDGGLLWTDMYIAPVKDDFDKVTHFVTALYDITEMKRYESELEHQARHDTLTGLVNRNVLRDRLSQSIVYGARYNHQVWVLFLDLDRFKFVNDTLGHNAGDQLLNKVAALLKAFTREFDTIARLGGDEFVLILPERPEEILAVNLIQRLMDAIAKPLQIEGHDFFLTCSVGVAVYPNDGQDPETLLKNADIAMYRAKEMGSNNYQFYTAAMNERALERLRIEGDLRTALERKEFVLHYQPQVDVRTGRIIGMEALIRWIHPKFGAISPIRFIEVAEETGMIVQIGAWVLRTACEFNKDLQRKGLGYLRVAVNLSVRQFYQKDLVQSIIKTLNDTELTPHYLEVELTESLVMSDVELAVGILKHLKSVGVQLSIDDFGTGYSSLAYLKRFPIDALKIDQSFVRDITNDQDDAAIVASIISLAHNLRLQVIAEGVETNEQIAFLRRQHCDEIQGFYFSPPVSSEAFEAMLREGKML